MRSLRVNEMIRRGALGRAVAVAATGLLAACTGGKSEPAISLKVDRPVTVSLMGSGAGGGASNAIQMTQLDTNFKQLQPNVTVDVQSAGVSGTDYTTKLIALTVAGTPPDVFIATGNDVPSFVAKGVFRPIDDLIKSDSSFKPDDWFDVHTAAWKIKGKQVGLPWQGGPHLTYYNKSLFEAAGVEAPTDAAWTWDAWRDAATKLRRVMNSGEITRWPTEIGPWLNFLYAGGGEVIDKDYKHCVLDGTAAVNALQRMADYIQRDQIAPSARDMGTTKNNRMFMDSRLAVIIMNRFDASVEGFFQPWVGVANQPKGPAGRFSGSNVDGFGMAAATKEVPAAWELQKFRTGDTFRRAVHASGNGGVPALKSTANSPEYLNEKLPPEWNRFFIQAISTIRLPPAIPAWSDILTAAGKTVVQIQNGESSPASAVKDLVPRVDALLKTS